jgi:hypothetical protein
MSKTDLQGALELIILKILAQTGEMHGYGIAVHVETASSSLLRVEEGLMVRMLLTSALHSRANRNCRLTKRLAVLLQNI